MGKVRLFASWTFSRPLPEPFAAECARVGRRTTNEDGCMSIHNRSGRKMATMHSATIRALIALAGLVNGDTEGGTGYHMENGEITCYCLEHIRKDAGVRENRVSVYEPYSGIWKCVVRNGVSELPHPPIHDKGSSGMEALLILAYASTVKEGKLYDAEFASDFCDFAGCWKNGTDISRMMQLGYRLCDNLYRRIEGAGNNGTASIPFRDGTIAGGNVPMLQQTQIADKEYSLTKITSGNFEVLSVQPSGSPETIGSLKGKYDRHFLLTEEEKALVPQLPETYDVPEEVTEILDAVCNTPMRVFMSAGESGTGKTTNAKMVAQLLGLPYYFFTCGEGTDEVDLISSMIPNVGKRNAAASAVLPSFRDMCMDPASALVMAGGTYEEDIDEETAFLKIQEAIYRKGMEAGLREKDFQLVESSIVTGCRRPSVIEIQEPSVITKAGTLVRLNGLLDDGAAITLTDGEVVRRNPETVILLTTNMGYKGCRGFNESVLSRMRMILYSDPLKADDMVKRIRKKIPEGSVGIPLLRKMAEVVTEIQEFARTEMIDGGVCGYREYEDWVWAYLIQRDVCSAARRTIVAKAAPRQEDRDEIYKTQILTKFQEGKAA